MLNGNFHLVWAVAAAYTFPFKNENMDQTAQKDDKTEENYFPLNKEMQRLKKTDAKYVKWIQLKRLHFHPN